MGSPWRSIFGMFLGIAALVLIVVAISQPALVKDVFQGQDPAPSAVAPPPPAPPGMPMMIGPPVDDAASGEPTSTSRRRTVTTATTPAPSHTGLCTPPATSEAP
jgi:hypothetical protein